MVLKGNFLQFISCNVLVNIDVRSSLVDCLTKSSAKADKLIKSVMTGVLPNVDVHPPFRAMLQNKAFLVEWFSYDTTLGPAVLTFLAEDISAEVYSLWHTIPESLCEETPLDKTD